jgi:quercetin dioxygenase-like cupin family protein
MSREIQVQHLVGAQTQEFDWGQLTWYASAALGNSAEMTVGRCVLKPGQGNPRHYHPNCSEILVVVQGRIRHTAAENREVELGEGDTVTIPPNVWHCATNIGGTEAVLFIAFSSAERKTVGEEVAS